MKHLVTSSCRACLILPKFWGRNKRFVISVRHISKSPYALMRGFLQDFEGLSSEKEKETHRRRLSLTDTFNVPWFPGHLWMFQEWALVRIERWPLDVCQNDVSKGNHNSTPAWHLMNFNANNIKKICQMSVHKIA